MKKILSALLAFTIACTSYVGVGGINPNTSSIVYATENTEEENTEEENSEEENTEEENTEEENSEEENSEEENEEVAPYTYTISGDSVTITKYTGTETNVVIPETIEDKSVTAIYMQAFYQNTTLKSIEIPSSVTEIGANAFNGCTALATVTINSASARTTSDGLTKIGSKAFGGCTSLTEITLPSSLDEIGNQVFSNCEKLETITFLGDAPSSVLNDSGTNLYPNNTNYSLYHIIGADATIKFSSSANGWDEFIECFSIFNGGGYANESGSVTVDLPTPIIDNSSPKAGVDVKVSFFNLADLSESDYTIKWYTVDGETKTAIEDQTSQTLSTTGYDGKYICAGITYKGTTLSFNSTEQFSATFRVTGDDYLPTVMVLDGSYYDVESAVVGDTLEVFVYNSEFTDLLADYTNESEDYEVQWYTYKDGVRTEISGANDKTFVIPTGYEDKIIDVGVKYKGEDGTYNNEEQYLLKRITVENDDNDKDEDDDKDDETTLPTPTVKIEIGDSEVTGDTANASVGDTISITGASYTSGTSNESIEDSAYTWTIDGKDQSGTTYTVASEDAGEKLIIVVTIPAVEDSYKELTKTITVTIAELDGLPTPTVAIEKGTENTDTDKKDTYQVGDTLTVSVKDVTLNGDYAIKWYTSSSKTTDGRTAIDGQTGTTFTIPEDYEGKFISVGVQYTGEDNTYNDTEKFSDASMVDDGRIEIPEINFDSDDIINVGDVLSATVTGSGYQYQWFTVEKSSAISAMSIENYTYTPIDGATSSTYTITNADFGKQIAVAIALTGIDLTDLSKLDERYDYSLSALTQSIGKELLTISLSYEQDEDDDSKGTITAKYINGGVFGDDADKGELESNYTFEWKKGDDVIDGETNSTYDYDSPGTYTVTVTAEKDAKYTTTVTDGDGNETSTTVSDEVTVVVLKELPQPTISPTTNVTTGTTLKIDESAYTAIGVSNITFQWYAGSGDEFSIIGTGTSISVKDSYSAKDIYVIATPSKSIEDEYKNSKNSTSVTVETVYYSATFVLDTLEPYDASGNYISANPVSEAVEYNGTYYVTLKVESDHTDTHSLPSKTDITLSMAGTGTSIPSFTYSQSTGLITVPNVTGNITITATATTDIPDSGKNTPTIILDSDSMKGVTTSRTILTNADLNSDGNYELTLSAGTALPDKISIKFTATVTMSLVDGYSYDKETGLVTIDPSKFSSSMGYYATIYGEWTDGNPNDDVTATSYNVEVSASGTGITTITEKSQSASAGYPMNISIETETGYSSPLSIVSIKMTDSSGTTTLTSGSDYSANGTTITIKAGVITDDCTIVIEANATADTATTHKVSLYLEDNRIDIADGVVNFVVDNGTYELTLIPPDGYNLPTSIKVYMGVIGLTAGTDYSYSSTTGKVEIKNVTADLEIVVGDATNAITHSVTHKLTNATFVSGDAAGNYEDGSTYIAYFKSKSDDYYDLRTDDVHVTMDGKTLTSDTDYTFDSMTGKLYIIKKITGDVVITIEALEIPSKHSVYFNFWGLYADDVLKANNYEVSVTHETSYNTTIKIKDGFATNYEVPDSIDTIVGIVTGDEYVEGEDYDYYLSGEVGVLKLYDVIEDVSIKIVATLKADAEDDSYEDDDDDDDTSTSSTYKITFVDATGSTVTTLTTGTNKTLSYLPTLTVSDGLVFVGWYTSGGTKITTSTVFSGDRTIYAKVLAVTTPTSSGGTDYYISTSSSEIAIYASSLKGGTITVTGTSTVNNFIIVPPSSNYSVTSTTSIVIPDSNGNTVMWSIPAGAVIDDDNYLNLGVSVSENAINTSTSLGRSLGYVDFAHSGALLANGAGITFTFRNYQASTGDTLQFYKLDDYNDFVGNYLSSTAIGNYYVRTTMYSCSRWELIARNYVYNPGANGGSGGYTQYYNIPTTGYISELRNVQLGQVINLTAINVGNGLIVEGWYYDKLFTNRVSNPSYVVVSEAIIQSGLYPKYTSDYVTPDYGNPWPDAGNNYNPNLTDTPVTNTK